MNRKTIPITYDDGQDWIAVVNYEVEKCKNWTLKDVTETNLVNQLNEKLKLKIC